MSHPCVASYDVGTSSVKAVLVDFHGKAVSSSTAGYSLLTPHPDWAEQDPGSYWDAVCKATRQALTKGGIRADDVKGVVFCTQWKGIIPVDGEGNVLYNAIIWRDGRAGAQAARLNEAMGTTRFGNYDYWPKLMWIKDELPEIYEKTAYFHEVSSFVKFKATGRIVVDLTNSFTRSVHKKLQAYYDTVLAAAELDPGRFPPLVMSPEKVGGLTARAAGELGLCEGTPVFGGCGDIPAIAIGAGCSSMDSAHIYLGSSSWIGTVIPERIEGKGQLYSPLDQDREVMAFGIQSACTSYDWAIDQFYHVEKEILQDDIYDFIDRQVIDIEPGSLNLVAAPWLHGELPPLSNKARAVFFNVTHRHDRRHFVNAVMEGICYHLRWFLEVSGTVTGKAVDSIHAVGGGASSDPWMQVMANILRIPVEVPANAHHAGAIGAAYCAFVGLGLCQSFEEADEMVSIEKTFLPDKACENTYDTLFDVYRKLYPTLVGMFAVLNP